MGAREVIKHVLSLVGVAQVHAAQGTRRLANITFYESRRAAGSGAPRAEVRR